MRLEIVLPHGCEYRLHLLRRRLFALITGIIARLLCVFHHLPKERRKKSEPVEIENSQ